MNSKSNIEHYSDQNWSKNGFSTMEEIRRMGKLCDITLVVSKTLIDYNILHSPIVVIFTGK
jgi:hypothetical protein